MKPFQLVFSARGVARDDRMEALSEAFAPVTCIDADSPAEVPDFIHTRVCCLRELVVAETRISPGESCRPPCASSPDDETLILSIATRGAFIRRNRRGGEHLLRPGEACIALISERRFPTDAGFVDIAIPKDRLKTHLAKTDLLTAPPVKDGSALRLLTHYAAGLVREDRELSPELAGHCEDHLCDLASLVLSGSRSPLRDPGTGIRAARLQTIQSDIRAHLCRTDLNANWMASRHGISPQYLRALFNGVGTTFRDYVLDLRLERAHALLRDTHLAHVRISAIAFECGFGDLSYFNRCFRRRYHMTPSDLRALTRDQGGQAR